MEVLSDEKYPADIIETVAKAIYDNTFHRTPYTWEEVAAFTDDAGVEWAFQMRAAAVAALDALGLTVAEEYSIAYPDGHPDEGRWSTDGADTFDTLEEAEQDLRWGGYLDTDRVVRRLRAKTEWVEVTDDAE